MWIEKSCEPNFNIKPYKSMTHQMKDWKYKYCTNKQTNLYIDFNELVACNLIIKTTYDQQVKNKFRWLYWNWLEN